MASPVRSAGPRPASADPWETTVGLRVTTVRLQEASAGQAEPSTIPQPAAPGPVIADPAVVVLRTHRRVMDPVARTVAAILVAVAMPAAAVITVAATRALAADMVAVTADDNLSSELRVLREAVISLPFILSRYQNTANCSFLPTPPIARRDRPRPALPCPSRPGRSADGDHHS